MFECVHPIAIGLAISGHGGCLFQHIQQSLLEISGLVKPILPISEIECNVMAEPFTVETMIYELDSSNPNHQKKGNLHRKYSFF